MISVIAHRGLRSEKPENTLASIRAALEVPHLHGVEFDVELTSDGGLVALHQETMTPDSAFAALEPAPRNFTSRDWVYERTLAEVTSLSAGSWKGSHYAPELVPTLEQVLGLPWKDVMAYVELKDATFWGKRDPLRPGEVVKAALPLLQAHEGVVVAISFNPEILRTLHTHCPEIQTGLLLWTEWRGLEEEAITQAIDCGAGIISLPYSMALESSKWVQMAHEKGLQVHTYPVSPAYNEPEFQSWSPQSQASAWRDLVTQGVDAIVSDFGRESMQALSCLK